jgi:hypothetical protein
MTAVTNRKQSSRHDAGHLPRSLRESQSRESSMRCHFDAGIHGLIPRQPHNPAILLADNEGSVAENPAAGIVFAEEGSHRERERSRPQAGDRSNFFNR